MRAGVLEVVRERSHCHAKQQGTNAFLEKLGAYESNMSGKNAMGQHSYLGDVFIVFKNINVGRGDQETFFKLVFLHLNLSNTKPFAFNI